MILELAGLQLGRRSRRAHVLPALLAGLLLFSACRGGSSETIEQIVPRTSPTTAPTSTPLEAAATSAPPQESATASATPLPAASPAHARAPARPVLLAAVGDVMLARSIGARLEANGADTAFAEVSEILAGADIALANLETAIAAGGAPEPKGYTFRAPPIAADALVAAGIDLVSLANNHALDYGPDALAETQSLLSERGIRSVGAGPERARARHPLRQRRHDRRPRLCRGPDRERRLQYTSLGGNRKHPWRRLARRSRNGRRG